MNPELDSFLTQAEAVMVGSPNGVGVNEFDDDSTQAIDTTFDSDRLLDEPPRVHVGVDLGTAYTVLTVLDPEMRPLAGEYRFAEVVRDGLVVDFHGAISLVEELKSRLEDRLGLALTSAATTYPPGVARQEVQATRHVVEAAGFLCDQIIDEPTAANAVLRVENGAVVDVGGGTTGIAIFQDGEVIYTADEPSGGTHFSLVIAGALDLEFEEAEALKKDNHQHQRLYPIVRPVMEKVGTIVAQHIAAHSVDTIYLVGGTSCFTGIGQVVEEVTGIATIIPRRPMFVTPFGVAMYDT